MRNDYGGIIRDANAVVNRLNEQKNVLSVQRFHESVQNGPPQEADR